MRAASGSGTAGRTTGRHSRALPGTMLATEVRMSSTVRPDNVKAALDAKRAAALSQLAELREAEEPPVTLHLSPRESIVAFLQYACRIQPIADAFGREQAGDLVFDAWYGEWLSKLDAPDRAVWQLV